MEQRTSASPAKGWSHLIDKCGARPCSMSSIRQPSTLPKIMGRVNARYRFPATVATRPYWIWPDGLLCSPNAHTRLIIWLHCGRCALRRARLRPIGPFFERDEQALKEHSHAHVLSEINQTPTLKKDDYRGGLCNKTVRRKNTYTVESTTAPSNVLRMRPGPKQVRFTIPFVKPYAA